MKKKYFIHKILTICKKRKNKIKKLKAKVNVLGECRGISLVTIGYEQNPALNENRIQSFIPFRDERPSAEADQKE